MKRGRIQYHPSAVKKLVERVCSWSAAHTDLVARMKAEEDFSLLHSAIASADPAYGSKKDCYGCGAHMKLATYTLGIMEALLMLEMAKDVRSRTEKGVAFTEANMVHVMTLPTSDAIRHAITRAKYLGLVAQPEKKRGAGHWVITHWGWKLLKGAPVPRYALYWRKRLLERSEEQTTLGEAFRTHTDDVRRALDRRREVRNDFRAVIEGYSASEWVDFGGYAEDVAEKIPEDPAPVPWWAK